MSSSPALPLHTFRRASLARLVFLFDQNVEVSHVLLSVIYLDSLVLCIYRVDRDNNYELLELPESRREY
jgi:hypothetical protein